MAAIINTPSTPNQFAPLSKVVPPPGFPGFPGLPGQVPVDRLPTTPGEGPFVPEPGETALMMALALVVALTVKTFRKNKTA